MTPERLSRLETTLLAAQLAIHRDKMQRAEELIIEALGIITEHRSVNELLGVQ